MLTDTKIIVELKYVTDRFVDILHELYGFAIDSEAAYNAHKQNITKWHKHGVPSLIVSNSNPDDPNALILHYASTQDIISRNETNGANINKMWCYIIVMLYAHWEEDIRKKIATILEVEVNNIKSDIMGDINKIRQDILHKRGWAENSVHNKIIAFEINSQIVITSDIFNKICNEIFKYLNSLFFQYTGKMAYSDNSLNQKAKEIHRSIEHKIF